MLRHALYLVALSLVVSPVACKKKSDDAGTSKSGSKKDDDGEDKGKKKASKSDDEDEGDDKKAEGSKACKFPKETTVKADWTIPTGCKLKVKDNLTVDDGATLTIEPGAKLSFDAGKYLWIGNGKVVAKGTEEEPIVFTSSASSPSAGDWEGVILDAKTGSGTVFDHVTFEYAGHSGAYARGALTVYNETQPGRVTITNSTFQNNAQAGITNDHEKAKFAKVEGNTFKKNGGASLHLDPNVVGSVGRNTFDEPIKVAGGHVRGTATWPSPPSFLILDNLTIEGSGQTAVLTLADKSVLKFANQKYLWIGAGDGSGLVAKGVTFTSMNDSPSAGDWEGIIIDSKAKSTVIEDCVVEYAGHTGSYAHAAITFYNDPPSKLKGVKIKGCTFRHNEHGGIYPHGEKDCAGLDKDNKSEEQPVCVTKD